MDVYLKNQNENLGGLVSKKAVGKSMEGRQSLSVLQPTHDTRNLTRAEPAKMKKDKKSIIGQKKTFAIFEDAKSKTKPKPEKCECINAEVQTESEDCCHCMCHENKENEDTAAAEQEAFKLMCQDEVPTEYWKQLAESRREALEESLHENEMLHSELKDLRDENSRLSELAEHAEYFANILKTVTDGDENGESKNDNDPSTAAKETERTSESPTKSGDNLNLRTDNKKAVEESDSGSE